MPSSSTSGRLQPFAKNVWIANGPVVSFYGFSYPTRMVAIRLLHSKPSSSSSSKGVAWIWSPVALTPALAKQVVQEVGEVKFIVSPNMLHWMYLKEWQDKFPQARIYANSKLAHRKVVKDIKFDTIFQEDDQVPQEYDTEMDQLTIRGGPMEEVCFLHKPSRTAITCDLIQRLPEQEQTGWKGWLMKADGLVGPLGSTPREWRFLFCLYGHLPEARKKLNIILHQWKPDKLIIAHGECAHEGASLIIEQCLDWIPKEPGNSCCGFCSPPAASADESDEDDDPMESAYRVWYERGMLSFVPNSIQREEWAKEKLNTSK